jgi:F-type H+-transporting ATPase subunit b
VQIDWLTVAAQIVNFLVLVWLLQRFLYKPITNAMRRREERIEERLAEAKTARQEVENEAQQLEKEQAELDESKEDILDAARQEAEELREKREAEIREEMEEKREAWRQHLADERDEFVSLLRRKAGRKVLEISKRVLTDYADSDLTERVIATFADKVKTLDSDARAKMSDAASEEGAKATIHSGAAIDSASKGRITRAIHEVLSSDIDVAYEEDPELVLGVRLTIGDYSAEWSATRYLKQLETELEEIIDAGSRGAADASETSENEEHETA